MLDHASVNGSQITPPLIEPLPEGDCRPFWSVMIPTYNCAKYLRETLASVLAQNIPPEDMQIEVIDDCSTADRPEDVVQELGQGRVDFWRQPQNGGAINNFNTCIRRSRGHYVHILHGDDAVEPTFYERLGGIARNHPEVTLLATRSMHINEASVPLLSSPRTPQLEKPTSNASSLFYENTLRTPGIVVKRSFYEAHGGFLPHLIHTADWEMWVRAICKGRGIMLPDLLARYREFQGNDTSRLARLGENLRDYQRLSEVLAANYDAFDLNHFRSNLRYISRHQWKRMQRLGIEEAVLANRKIMEEIWSDPLPLSNAFRSHMACAPLIGPAAVATLRAFKAVLSRFNRN